MLFQSADSPPPGNIEEQIKWLSARGLELPNREYAFRCLSHIGFHRLSALQSEPDYHQDGTKEPDPPIVAPFVPPFFILIEGDFATQSRTAEAQALSKIRQPRQGRTGR